MDGKNNANERISNNGYSAVVNDPEFIAGMSKSIRKKMPLRMIGSIVFAAILLFQLFVFGGKIQFPYKTLIAYAIFIAVKFFIEKKKVSKINDGCWEGIISSKVEEAPRDENGIEKGAVYKYIFVEDKEGKVNKIANVGELYTYAEKGDRVLIHPNHTYKVELRDKDKYKTLFCSMCGCANEFTETHCYKCGGKLLK